MKKTRILLVDDHALLRRGLADLLRYESDLAVVGEAGDGEAAVEAATFSWPVSRKPVRSILE